LPDPNDSFECARRAYGAVKDYVCRLEWQSRFTATSLNNAVDAAALAARYAVATELQHADAMHKHALKDAWNRHSRAQAARVQRKRAHENTIVFKLSSPLQGQAIDDSLTSAFT
jgi:hypothetical protein